MNSTVGPALDTFAANLRALFADDPAVLVSDGPTTTYTRPNLVEIIGVDDWRQEPAGLGNYRRDEVFSIECELRVFQGDQPTTPQVRDTAFTLLDRIEDAITADPNLSGTEWNTGPGVSSPSAGSVRFSQLQRGRLRQGTTGKGGWAVEIEFSVQCEATIERTP